MSDAKQQFFADDQIQQLILTFLHGRQGETPVEEIHAYLNACIGAVALGESVKLVAEGFLTTNWNSTTGRFAFGLTEAGKELSSGIAAQSEQP